MQAHALWRVKTAARLSESDLRVISGLQPAKAGFLCTEFSSADAKPRQQKLPQIPGPPAKGFMRSQGSKSCRKVQDPQPRALCEAKAAKAAAKSRTPSQGLYSKPRQQNLLQIPGQPAKGFIRSQGSKICCKFQDSQPRALLPTRTFCFTLLCRLKEAVNIIRGPATQNVVGVHARQNTRLVQMVQEV